MPKLSNLARDTAIYGLSSIVGRFLNYLLVPLYTQKMTAASGDYGIVTNAYAYTALLLALLTYGMETTLFRFCSKSELDERRVYSTILTTVATTSLLFVALVVANIGWIAPKMGLAYADHPSYIITMAIVVALDAFQAISFTWLRHKKRPLKFACLKLLFIGLNIGLNLLYFVVFPAIEARHPGALRWVYDPSVGVGYVFYLNLVCTVAVQLCLWREVTAVPWRWDRQLLRQMFRYSWPILVLSVTGVINQSASQIIFPWIYPGTSTETAAQLGIYGAAIKIAMIMSLITQAFRYAYEPFIFGQSKEKSADSKDTQAQATKYFLIFTLIAYLAVIAGIDVLKHIIGSDYWEGLRVVPVVMAAEIMMGVYFNFSFWAKLTDRTLWNAVFSIIGCAMLVLVNVLFVPRVGYMACAWAGVAAYGSAMTLSYLVGQRYYPINYPIGQMLFYVVLTAVLSAAAMFTPIANVALLTAYRVALLMVLVAVVVRREHLGGMLRRLPVVGRWLRK